MFTDPTEQLEHGTEKTAASTPSVYLKQLKRRVLLRSRAFFLAFFLFAALNIVANKNEKNKKIKNDGSD